MAAERREVRRSATYHQMAMPFARILRLTGVEFSLENGGEPAVRLRKV
ncbi:hypothetical protein [Methylobacterium soli]|nr:hypothetical protein [Methylobacterium soli]GJE46220.1 hypothetical protein AEGHOMDF_5420 [Methylobacterium soli]